jgi:hypothetical protein
VARRTAALKVAEEALGAELDEVQEFAENLPEKYLQCRELGHLWRPWTAASNPDGGFDRTLRCTRCHTKREQVITNRGVVVTNKYIHPEGYLHKGMGRIIGEGRGLLRLESIKRTVTKIESKKAS